MEPGWRMNHLYHHWIFFIFFSKCGMKTLEFLSSKLLLPRLEMIGIFIHTHCLRSSCGHKRLSFSLLLIIVTNPEGFQMQNNSHLYCDVSRSQGYSAHQQQISAVGTVRLVLLLLLLLQHSMLRRVNTFLCCSSKCITSDRKAINLAGTPHHVSDLYYLRRPFSHQWLIERLPDMGLMYENRTAVNRKHTVGLCNWPCWHSGHFPLTLTVGRSKVVRLCSRLRATQTQVIWQIVIISTDQHLKR